MSPWPELKFEAFKVEDFHLLCGQVFAYLLGFCLVLFCCLFVFESLLNLSNPSSFSFLSGALFPAGQGLGFLGAEYGPAGEPSDVWMKRLAFV